MIYRENSGTNGGSPNKKNYDSFLFLLYRSFCFRNAIGRICNQKKFCCFLHRNAWTKTKWRRGTGTNFSMHSSRAVQTPQSWRSLLARKCSKPKLEHWSNGVQWSNATGNQENNLLAGFKALHARLRVCSDTPTARLVLLFVCCLFIIFKILIKIQTLTTRDRKGPQTNMPKNLGSELQHIGSVKDLRLIRSL